MPQTMWQSYPSVSIKTNNGFFVLSEEEDEAVVAPPKILEEEKSDNGFACVAAPLCAENRLTAPGGDFVEGSTGESVQLMANHDPDLYGFSFGISYDPAVISVTDVTWTGR